MKSTSLSSEKKLTISKTTKILNKIMLDSKQHTGWGFTTDPFNKIIRQDIGIEEYLTNIFSQTQCSVDTVILILIFIDKICKRKNLLINENNVLGLIMITAFVIVRYYENKSFTPENYETIFKASLKDILRLEIEFMKTIDFELKISKESYEKYRLYISYLR